MRVSIGVNELLAVLNNKLRKIEAKTVAETAMTYAGAASLVFLSVIKHSLQINEATRDVLRVILRRRNLLNRNNQFILTLTSLFIDAIQGRSSFASVSLCWKQQVKSQATPYVGFAHAGPTCRSLEPLNFHCSYNF